MCNEYSLNLYVILNSYCKCIVKVFILWCNMQYKYYIEITSSEIQFNTQMVEVKNTSLSSRMVIQKWRGAERVYSFCFMSISVAFFLSWTLTSVFSGLHPKPLAGWEPIIIKKKTGSNAHSIIQKSYLTMMTYTLLSMDPYLLETNHRVTPKV